MAATKSYVISVDSIPCSGLRHRRHLAANVIYAGRHTIARRPAGAHRAGRRGQAQRANLRDAGMRVKLARLDAAWLGQVPDDFSFGGGRHRATAAEVRRRRTARTEESRRALIVRSGLTVLMVVFVAAVVAGAWFSTSGAVAFASIVQP